MNNIIELLEYYPVGRPDPANPLQYIGFPGFRYDMTNNGNEINRMLDEQAPYAYIPVNGLQAKRFAQYCLAGWEATGDIGYANARYFDPFDATPSGSSTIGERYLSRLTFPPPKYDAYVLISVGPGENMHGMLPQPISGQGPAQLLDAYHIIGLRAYFLATRDINTNGKLDFDFRARTRESENSTAFSVPELGYLPDGSGAPGPLIFVQAG
jgi:hypothetical protein